MVCPLMHKFEAAPMTSGNSALAFCRAMLPEVSRTFALNIPVLPAPLDEAVTVAYLLCRIADTVEDEAGCGVMERMALLVAFRELIERPSDAALRAQVFSKRAHAALRANAPKAEVVLLEGTDQVVQALAQLPEWTWPHLARCVRVMTEGMAQVTEALGDTRSPQGLPDLAATLTYCYYVAGIVGEMLTGLFIGYSPRVAARAEALVPRSAAFGRALQLTNILKDVREDLERGSCWLPRTLMDAHGVTPETLLLPALRVNAVALLDELVRAARVEADAALEYSLALPAEEPELRLFCLWPLFFSVATLGTLSGNPAVFEPEPVKISRATVQQIMAETRARVTSDEGLRALYLRCAAITARAPVDEARA